MTSNGSKLRQTESNVDPAGIDVDLRERKCTCGNSRRPAVIAAACGNSRAPEGTENSIPAGPAIHLRESNFFTKGWSCACGNGDAPGGTNITFPQPQYSTYITVLAPVARILYCDIRSMNELLMMKNDPTKGRPDGFNFICPSVPRRPPIHPSRNPKWISKLQTSHFFYYRLCTTDHHGYLILCISAVYSSTNTLRIFVLFSSKPPLHYARKPPQVRTILKMKLSARRILRLHEVVLTVRILLCFVPPSPLALAFSTLPTSSYSSFSQEAYSTLGPAIANLDSFSTGLDLAARFWLPTDESLPPHFHQAVHHEKRQRLASQLLTQMATTHDVSADVLLQQDPRQQQALEALSRLIHAAALPHPSSSTSDDRLGKEGIWILDSLQAVHTILGRLYEYSYADKNGNDASKTILLKLLESSSSSSTMTSNNNNTILEGIQCLIDRGQACGAEYSLDQACRALWAIQGIQARLHQQQVPSSIIKREVDDDYDYDYEPSNFSILKQRVQALPFEIIPLGVDWSQLLPRPPPPSSSSSSEKNQKNHVCEALLQSIPFVKDTIVTRQGTSVAERRGTAWIAQEGIGALAYSGKLMAPQPLPPLVDQVMRTVEAQLEEQLATTTMGFFDCALCNHYADATAACKFHTDPEHGTMWDRTTVVVAAGSDRTFAFKPIDTTWEDWDTIVMGSSKEEPSHNSNNNNKAAATTTLFSGDLVVMRDNCNDDFYHAVHAGVSDEPRVSLVLKRAIGPRGHGLPGQGRRSKRKAKYEGGTSAGSSTGSSSSSSGSPPTRSRHQAATPVTKTKQRRRS